MSVNKSQLELIKSLIGFDGIYFETIKDEDGIDSGTKILYLERAISEDCQTFLKSLDKLYQPESNIELIRALKTINDLFFNNEVKNSDHGMKSALQHWFGRLGDIDNVDAFKKIIEELVNKGITVISIGKESEEIDKQKENRITAEETSTSQTGWRAIIDLPHAQSVFVGVERFNTNIEETLPNSPSIERHPLNEQSRANYSQRLWRALAGRERPLPMHITHQYATQEYSFFTRPRQTQGGFIGSSEFTSPLFSQGMPSLSQEQQRSLAEARERDLQQASQRL